MKKILVIIFLIVTVPSYSQFEPLLYDWEGNLLSFSNSKHITTTSAYGLTIPAAGHISIGLRHSGFSAYDLFNTVSDFNTNWKNVLDNLGKNKGLFSKIRTEWFHYTWKNFEFQHHITVSTETELWFFHPVSMYHVAAYG